MLFLSRQEPIPPVASLGQTTLSRSRRRSHQGLLLCLLLAGAGCAPAVRAAGHSVSPETQTSPGDTQNKPLTTESSVARKQAASSVDQSTNRELAHKNTVAEIPQGGQLIGESGGIALEALSHSGHWVAYCQGESGTNTVPTDSRGNARTPHKLYLHVGEKKRLIDGLLASSIQGRYLVTQESGAAWLTDAANNKRWNLSQFSPDLRSDGYAEHRSFAFTAHALIILSRSADVDAYFLPLPTEDAERQLLGTSKPIDFGERTIWRLQGGDSFVTAVTLPASSPETSWPSPRQNGLPHRCLSPTNRYPAFSRVSAYRPDQRIAHSWLSLPDSHSSPKKSKGSLRKENVLHAMEAPGYIMGFGDHWVRREDSGRVVVVRGDTQKRLTTSKCGSRILHADTKSGLFLIACEEYTPIAKKRVKRSKRRKKTKYRFDLYLARPGFVVDLKADVARTGVDVKGAQQGVLLPLRPGAEAALVDFEQRKISRLKGAVQVLVSNANQALLRRGDKLSLWSKEGEEDVDILVPQLSRTTTKKQAVALGARMFLLTDDLKTWELPGEPLDITPLGYALIPRKPATLNHWPEGPLRLIAPPEDSPGLNEHAQSSP